MAAFNYINIINALNEANKVKAYRALHREWQRIYDEDQDLDKAAQLTRMNYTQLFEVMLNDELKEQYRMDAALCIFYKQNVYEIDTLVVGY